MEDKKEQELIKKAFEYLYDLDTFYVRNLFIEIYGGDVQDETLYIDYTDNEIALKRVHDLVLLCIGYTENSIRVVSGQLRLDSLTYYYFKDFQEEVDEHTHYLEEDEADIMDLTSRIRKLKIDTITE